MTRQELHEQMIRLWNENSPPEERFNEVQSRAVFDMLERSVDEWKEAILPIAESNAYHLGKIAEAAENVVAQWRGDISRKPMIGQLREALKGVSGLHLGDGEEVKVWIVVGCIDYSASYPLGVFTTEEQAWLRGRADGPRWDAIEVYEAEIDSSAQPEQKSSRT